MIDLRPTPFEIARQTLRQLLEFMRYELRMPEESVRLQVDAIMRSFAAREMLERQVNTPEGK